MERPVGPQLIPNTPTTELERIQKEQVREGIWWNSFESVQSEEDIASLLADGRAVNVSATNNYRISTHTPERFNVLRIQAKQLLDTIATRWRVLIPDPERFLVVTSLARTVAYQTELQDQGYPGVTDSTHTKLAAFDISTAWFSQHDQLALEALLAVVTELHEAGFLNSIIEPTVGVIHICVNPAAFSQ